MKMTLGLLAASALVLLIFGFWPQIDLATSALFFDGTTFPLATDPWNNALRSFLRVTPFLPPLFGLGVLLAQRWLPELVLSLGRREWGAILATFLLGPGLLVNRGFKAYWGRARPHQVSEFGGDAMFTPPHVWTDQCAANCSFVSGEVSAVAALAVALIILLAANRARLGKGVTQAGMVIACVLPLLSAFQRISAGAHFLSDSILAVLFTLLVAYWVGRIVAPRGG
jgi:lipid A 4'-phosphatase